MYGHMMETVGDLLDMGESGCVEFKQDLTDDPVKWLKTAVAFSNGSGGTIVFGVDDSKSPVGIPDSDIEPYLERISKHLNEDIVPLVSHMEEVTEHKGVYLILVRIGPGAEKPYRIRGGEVYIRSGRSTLRACEESIFELRLMSKSRSYDQLDFMYGGVTFPPSEESLRYITERMESAGVKDYSVAKMITQGLINESVDGLRISRGFELLTRNRDLFDVKCASFPDDRAIDFLDHAVYGGSIIEQIENAYLFVRKNVRCSGTVKGLNRTDTYDVPMIAVREAIINAVVHRSYLMTGVDVYVSVFPDRVEVESPGTMPVTLDGMKDGRSRRRNVVISGFLQTMGMMEGWGSGYRRMSEDCDSLGVPRPDIREIEDRVRVTLFRRNGTGSEISDVPVMSDIEYRMLNLFIENPRIKKRDVAERLGVSEPYVSKLIRIAKNRGVLDRNQDVRFGGWMVDEALMKRFVR